MAKQGSQNNVGQLKWVRADHKLPSHLTREIGRIVVGWAHLEHLVQRTVWSLIGVDSSAGRVAVRDPRMHDRLSMIKLLAEMRKVTLPEPEFGDLVKMTPELNGWRDLFAHGVWGTEDGVTWKAQQTKGKYSANDLPHSREKKLAPEAMEASVAGLQSIFGGIELMIEKANAVRLSVNSQIGTSQGIPPQQSD